MRRSFVHQAHALGLSAKGCEFVAHIHTLRTGREPESVAVTGYHIYAADTNGTITSTRLEQYDCWRPGVFNLGRTLGRVGGVFSAFAKAVKDAGDSFRRMGQSLELPVEGLEDQPADQ